MSNPVGPHELASRLDADARPVTATSAKGSTTLDIAAASPLIGTAVHHSHRVRDPLEQAMVISPTDRRFEEDPGTERFLSKVPQVLLPNQSRYEVDMNRPPDMAIYEGPEEAWGKEVWREPLPQMVRERVLERWYEYHRLLDALVQDAIDRYGRAIVLDLHSYNDRSQDPVAWMGNGRPVINLGTRFLDLDDEGRELVDWVLEALERHEIEGQPLSVAENAVFVGGYLNRRLSRTFGPRCITLSLEYKKIFMDPEGQDLRMDVLDALVEQFDGILEELAERVGTRLRQRPLEASALAPGSYRAAMAAP